MNVAAFLIPTLILVSGLVAFIGNLVGRNIGRRRLTLLGLRPRYTAQIITVVTGMLITVVTLAVVLLVSNEARQALFHLRDLQEQTKALEAQIRQQRQELEALQKGEVAYLKDQEVLRAIIDGRAPPADIQRQVQAFADLASQAARQRGIAPGPDGIAVHLRPPANVVAETIAERAEQRVIRMLATENTVKGLPLTADVIDFGNRLVFKEGETIATRMVDGGAARDQIEAALLDLVTEVASIAKVDGIISPPFALVGAPPDVRIDPVIFLQTLDRVKASRGRVEVRAVALVDTYTIGPVQLTFR